MVGAVAERLTAALCIADSIPIQNKYLYDLHFVVPGLTVCVCEFNCLYIFYYLLFLLFVYYDSILNPKSEVRKVFFL